MVFWATLYRLYGMTHRPDPDLTAAIKAATRSAIERLRSEEVGPFCLYALVTSGEALRPYLSITLDDSDRWNPSEGPFDVYGDEFFAPLKSIYDERGDIFDMAPDAGEAEYRVRLLSMEAALRELDESGLFGSGAEREKVLLLVTAMPPDETDAEFAQRLNPDGPLLTAWLQEASEGHVADA